MKKLILAMVFVFATGTTFMNANTTNKEVIIEEVAEVNCFDEALEFTQRFPEATYDMIKYIVERCEAREGILPTVD